MKKIIIFLFLTFVFLTACEKDDFCSDNPVTPSLIIRFFDDDNRATTKDARRLSVWAEGKDTLTQFTSVNTDSIIIPLNSIDTTTVYNFKINVGGNNPIDQIAKFTVNYTTEEEFVSRSCGFKVNFNNLSFSASENSWIKDFTPETLTTINNQNAAHVQIFH